MLDTQLERIRRGQGFLAALDQSGGSTPSALAAYGIGQNEYSTPEAMFDLVHALRLRIATSPAFDSRILGAILFDGTFRRDIEGVSAARYLWETKSVVPFVKIDKGLADRMDDVQLLAPMGDLARLLSEYREGLVFGTKERSVIHEANPLGIKLVVAQQMEVAEQVLQAGLMPIIEPEISILSTTKIEAERLLRDELLAALETVSSPVMLKLTLPEEPNFYRTLVEHRNACRVVALSGGYSLEESIRRLKLNQGVIASFSRALTSELRVDQSDDEFDSTLDRTIDQITAASIS